MERTGRVMEEVKTVIAEDVEINGSVKCTGGVRIAGKLIGDLTCGGDVMVEKSCTTKGNLAVNSVVVLGQIKGNITARDRIELKGSARVAGDIKAKRLVVEDGVSLMGKFEITPTEGGGADLGADSEADSAAGSASDSEKQDEGVASAGGSHRTLSDSRARASQLFVRK